MKKIFLLIRGFGRSFLESKLKGILPRPHRTYFCYQNKDKLGVVLQQPGLCKVQDLCVKSPFQSEEYALRFLECFYIFLNGLIQMNTFSGNRLTIVVPYYTYYLIIMNFDYWEQYNKKSKRLIGETRAILLNLISMSNLVEFKPSSIRKPGLLRAKKATESEYEVE